MVSRRGETGRPASAGPWAPGEPFDEEMLDRQASSICILDRSMRITFVNRAWREYAAQNGGAWGKGKWRLGVSMLAAIPGVLRPFYADFFARAAEAGVRAEHSYECSSPGALRIFRMHVFPRTPEGVLVAHSLAEETPHTREARPAMDGVYRDAHGLIAQCSHCRRVRRAVAPEGEERAWDWVPEYLAQAPPGSVSHGLCSLCIAYYFHAPGPPRP